MSINPEARWRVGFYADRSLISKAIGGQGRGGWAHMTTFVSDTEVIDARVGHTVIRDSAGKITRIIDPGVQRRPASYLDANEYALVLSFPCSALSFAAGTQLLVKQLGKPYDSRGIYTAFVRGKMDNPDWREQSAWFCDELALWVLERLMLIQPLLSPPFIDTPGYAAGICMQAYGVHIESYRGDWVEKQVRAYWCARDAGLFR